jgi:uncharacterized protein (DUF362 family)
MEKDALQNRTVAVAAAEGSSELSLTNTPPMLQKVATALGWFSEIRGPLGSAIQNEARVAIKPNLVTDRNRGQWGIPPLVTSAALIRVVAEAALAAGPSRVALGDAPIQSCNLEKLLELMDLSQWAEETRQRHANFQGVLDFRRTTCVFEDGVRLASEDKQSVEDFVLFDLGRDSLLEPITNGHASFRVTKYDPAMMAKTHAPGKHQYLVSRYILDADVVINLPKLKTHKKAGVTCALKNLVGINGNKEFLPHHRVGGSLTGGDCYPGVNPLKRTLEFSLDRENSAGHSDAAKWWHSVTVQLQRATTLLGDKIGVEGAWSGNDTVWRTSLDLDRILMYGRSDGTMADTVQRRTLHIVDAGIDGQGDGPLAPEPLDMGLLIAGENAAAVDWVGAGLLGYDQQNVPIVKNAFAPMKWPLSDYVAEEIRLTGDLGTGRAVDLVRCDHAVKLPEGWLSARAGSVVTYGTAGTRKAHP